MIRGSGSRGEDREPGCGSANLCDMKPTDELIRARRATVKRLNGVKTKTCFWCDCSAWHLTRDHVVPVGFGGPKGEENIVPACWKCQQERQRLLCLHRDAGKLRNDAVRSRDLNGIWEAFDGFIRSVRRQQRMQEQFRELIERWIWLETERWGESPTAMFDFSLPEIPSVEEYPRLDSW